MLSRFRKNYPAVSAFAMVLGTVVVAGYVLPPLSEHYPRFTLVLVAVLVVGMAWRRRATGAGRCSTSTARGLSSSRAEVRKGE